MLCHRVTNPKPAFVHIVLALNYFYLHFVFLFVSLHLIDFHISNYISVFVFLIAFQFVVLNYVLTKVLLPSTMAIR